MANKDQFRALTPAELDDVSGAKKLLSINLGFASLRIYDNPDDGIVGTLGSLFIGVTKEGVRTGTWTPAQ